MKKLIKLMNFMHKSGLFVAELDLVKLSAAELTWGQQKKIERALSQRNSPFQSWFPPQQRVYFPLDASEVDNEEEYIADKYKYLQELLMEYGHHWTFKEIFKRQKGNEKLNYKWVKKNLIRQYANEIYESEVLKNFDRFSRKEDFQKYLLNSFDLLVNNLFNKNLTAEERLEEWGYTGSLEGTSMEDIFSKENSKGIVDDILKTIYFIHDEFYELFNDPIRISKKDNLYVVITNKPEDIATMSTGRRWTSCMDLSGGAHSEDVFCEIIDGGFVAYLIHKDDLDIDDPLARLHIRRFDSGDGRSVAVPESEVYSSGEDYVAFKKAVENWIEQKQGRIFPGSYTRSGGYWSDTFGTGRSEELLGLDYDFAPEVVIEVLKDPAEFILNEYDIKDTWVVKDSFYNSWEEYFRGEDHDEFGEYNYRRDPMFEFDFLKNEKVFTNEEKAKEWVKANSQTKDEFKQMVNYSLDNWLEGVYGHGYDEDEMRENEIREDIEREAIIRWIDTYDRYVIRKSNAMDKAITLGKHFTLTYKNKIFKDVIDKGVCYDYFKQNKEDLNFFYNLLSKSSKKQFYRLFPEDLEYDASDEAEIDYHVLSDAFENIKDPSKKRKKAEELKALLVDRINYTEIITPIAYNEARGTPSGYRPSELYFDTLVWALYNSGLVSFGNNFTFKLQEIITTLDEKLDNQTLYDEGRKSRIKKKVEEVIFSVMRSYDAHDPIALRMYKTKIQSLINSIKNVDSNDNIMNMAYKINNARDFVYQIRHLRESGAILIPELEELYGICRSIYDGTYDFKKHKIETSNENDLIIIKRKSLDVMTFISKIVSGILKRDK